MQLAFLFFLQFFLNYFCVEHFWSALLHTSSFLNFESQRITKNLRKSPIRTTFKRIMKNIKSSRDPLSKKFHSQLHSQKTQKITKYEQAFLLPNNFRSPFFLFYIWTVWGVLLTFISNIFLAVFPNATGVQAKNENMAIQLCIFFIIPEIEWCLAQPASPMAQCGGITHPGGPGGSARTPMPPVWDAHATHPGACFFLGFNPEKITVFRFFF